MSVWQLFFAFRGRIGQFAYFRWLIAVIFGGGLAWMALFGALDGIIGLHPAPNWFGYVGMTTGLLIVYSTLALTAKRLHDSDRTAWHLVLAAVPWTMLAFAIFLGPLLVLVFWAAPFVLAFVLPGTAGPNRFGPVPAGIAA